MKLFRSLGLLALLSSIFLGTAHAALNSAIVFEMRSTGNANNGGGFKTGASGVDYSQQDSPQATLTTLSVVNADTTKVTISLTDYTVHANDVGNVWRNTGGTSTAGWYEITAVDTVGNTWTLDRAIGTAAQTCGGRMGGAISTFQDAFFETLEPGNKVWVKYASPFNMTENLTVAKDGTAAAYITIEGYKTTRGDAPTGSDLPDIQATGSNFTFTFDDYWEIKYLSFNTGGQGIRVDIGGKILGCTSTTSTASGTQEAFDLGNGTDNQIINSKAVTTNSGAQGAITAGSSGSQIIGCQVDSAGLGITAAASLTINGCYIEAVTGISVGTAGLNITDTIMSGCTTAVNFSIAGAARAFLKNVTIYGAETPAGTGISIGATSTSIIWRNLILYGLTTGITRTTSADNTVFGDYSNFFNNTTDRTNVTAGANDVALDPQFTNAAAGDFSIGTNLKAAGFPGVFPGGLSTGYLDIGGVQRQESGGSSSSICAGG